MKEHITIYISINDLLLDPENPRLEGEGFTKETGQGDILKALLRDKKSKVSGIVNDIVGRDSLNPAHRFMVVKEGGKPGKYTVLDGNRRLAALKYLQDPEAYSDLIEPQQRFFDFRESNPSIELDCVVFGDLEEAEDWIELEHAGEQEGAGKVPWDPLWRRNVATALMEWLGLEKKEFRGKVTVLERFFDDARVKKHFGIDYSEKKIRQFPSDADERGNIVQAMRRVKDITSRDINTREQLGEFFEGKIRGEMELPESKTAERVTDGDKPTPPPPKKRRSRGLEKAPALQKLLDAVDARKLSKLLHSFGSVSVNQHTPLLSVGLWSFCEGITEVHYKALHGEEKAKGKAFDTYVEDILPQRKSHPNWKDIHANRWTPRDIVDAAGRVAKYGNTTKHSAIAGMFTPDQLRADYKVLLPLFHALAKDIKDAKDANEAEETSGDEGG